MFDLLVRHIEPLAIMPSARTGPDHKHALEALWRKWVFLSFGIDRLDALVCLCPFQVCRRRSA